MFFGKYPTPPLQIIKDKAIYRDGSRIFACPIPEKVKKKAAAPLTLKFPKIPVASVEQVVEVQFAACGEGPPTFALAKGYDGLSIDAVHGKVTIDLPRIWKMFLAGESRPASPFAPHVQPAVETPNAPGVFHRLTGMSLQAGKTALRLPLRVSATNAAGESDEVRVSVVVVAAKDEVNKLAVRQKAQGAARQAEAQARIEHSQEDARAESALEKKCPREFLELLKALSTAVPTFDADATRARYDLRTMPSGFFCANDSLSKGR